MDRWVEIYWDCRWKERIFIYIKNGQKDIKVDCQKDSQQDIQIESTIDLKMSKGTMD